MTIGCDVPIYISLFRDALSVYASLTSEYVMPPATNTITRWRTSSGACDRTALCQLGLALRNEVVGDAAW